MSGRKIDIWCKSRKDKCCIYFNKLHLKSKDRWLIEKRIDNKISRVAITGLYPKDTDGKTYTSSSIICTYFLYLTDSQIIWKHPMIKKIISDITKSKSVYDFEETNDLLFCNMNMRETRKVTRKKVQICATVIDRNLWTSQGTMCRKEIYNTSL